jgi:DnaJ like chaperone protein
VWKRAKDSQISFDEYARDFYSDFGRERHQIMNMMDLLFATAASRRKPAPRGGRTVAQSRRYFSYRKDAVRTYQEQVFSHTVHAVSPQASWSPLDPHYTILGASPSDSLDEIKRKYRVLAVKWHPDKMAAAGASQEAQRHAKEKFQQINEAYEKVLEARR